MYILTLMIYLNVCILFASNQTLPVTPDIMNYPETLYETLDIINNKLEQESSKTSEILDLMIVVDNSQLGDLDLPIKQNVLIEFKNILFNKINRTDIIGNEADSNLFKSAIMRSNIAYTLMNILFQLDPLEYVNTALTLITDYITGAQRQEAYAHLRPNRFVLEGITCNLIHKIESIKKIIPELQQDLLQKKLTQILDLHIQDKDIIHNITTLLTQMKRL